MTIIKLSLFWTHYTKMQLVGWKEREGEDNHRQDGWGLIIAALGAPLGDQKDQITLKEVYLCDSLSVNVDVMMYNQSVNQPFNKSVKYDGCR